MGLMSSEGLGLEFRIGGVRHDRAHSSGRKPLMNDYQIGVSTDVFRRLSYRQLQGDRAGMPCLQDGLAIISGMNCRDVEAVTGYFFFFEQFVITFFPSSL